jgi:hypothetical protein
MVIESWRLFDHLQQKGVIPAGIKFQISLPTADLPALIPVLTTHLPSEVAAIAQALAQ